MDEAGWTPGWAAGPAGSLGQRSQDKAQLPGQPGPAGAMPPQASGPEASRPSRGRPEGPTPRTSGPTCQEIPSSREERCG